METFTSGAAATAAGDLATALAASQTAREAA